MEGYSLFTLLKGVEFISVSNNRHFEKDYILTLFYNKRNEDTNKTGCPKLPSNKHKLNNICGTVRVDLYNSSCFSQYKVMNIKLLIIEDIKGLKTKQ
ncbi:cell-death-related nuclease 7-like isoform X2 [Aphis craccivora]|uniref:Cell-death-related nuclease 7-like isoform X2 n=1 Tax=Aphis craccivora TaxID=307492 RepID=A0A6G0ZQN2_APHCR|nr:cell-death-related nuclease 7-like isoform X2 [Aphis craccivora]